MAHLTLSTLICLIGFSRWFVTTNTDKLIPGIPWTPGHQSPREGPRGKPRNCWLAEKRQNAPDKRATIKCLYKDLSPFLACGHTPNCQIKIKWMDEEDNDDNILSFQLFWEHHRRPHYTPANHATDTKIQKNAMCSQTYFSLPKLTRRNCQLQVTFMWERLILHRYLEFRNSSRLRPWKMCFWKDSQMAGPLPWEKMFETKDFNWQFSWKKEEFIANTSAYSKHEKMWSVQEHVTPWYGVTWMLRGFQLFCHRIGHGHMFHFSLLS